MEGKDAISGKIFGAFAVTGKKIFGKDNYFEMFNKVGTYFQKRVPCQLAPDF
jgi:hypothetical protein